MIFICCKAVVFEKNHQQLKIQSSPFLLSQNHAQKISVTPLGNHCFKIRLAIKSKGKGKSGGARVITFLETEIIGHIETNKEKQIIVNLVTIYDKSDVSTITNKELKELIANIEYEE